MLNVFTFVSVIFTLTVFIVPTYYFVSGLICELIDMSSEERYNFAKSLGEAFLLGLIVPAIMVGTVGLVALIIAIPLGGL
jgi:hypothetical protein